VVSNEWEGCVACLLEVGRQITDEGALRSSLVSTEEVITKLEYSILVIDIPPYIKIGSVRSSISVGESWYE